MNVNYHGLPLVSDDLEPQDGEESTTKKTDNVREMEREGSVSPTYDAYGKIKFFNESSITTSIL